MRARLSWLCRSVAEHAVGWIVGALLTSSAILVLIRGGGAWINHEWSCVHQPWCTVSGWSLELLLVGFVVVSTALMVLLWVLRWVLAYLPDVLWFRGIDVIDGRCNLRWIIVKPPRHWLHSRSNTQYDVMKIIDGPLHAVDGCNGRLALQYPGANLDPVCPTCGQLLFVYRSPHGPGCPLPAAEAVRMAVFQELERMDYDGIRIRGRRVVLRRPGYWGYLIPPGG